MTRPIDALRNAYGDPTRLADTPASPSFTVVIRTQGRRPDSLREAVDSVVAQTLAPQEVLVVVHGSADAAEPVRAAFEDRPTLRVAHVEGGGRAVPLNTGVDQATGDFICFLDDDDLAMPEWLAAFAAAAAAAPTTIIRAVTLSQPWTSEGGHQPVRSTGPVERPFPATFDLLAHMSVNHTPICSLAFPRAALDTLGLRFDTELAVFEDWEFLMRAAMALGVTSIPDETSLYRRLDHGNADTAEDECVWQETHAAVIARFSTRPVLLPAGDAGRLASTHFVIGGGSRHEIELAETQAELSALTRSPVRWARRFADRSADALRRRIAAQRP